MVFISFSQALITCIAPWSAGSGAAQAHCGLAAMWPLAQHMGMRLHNQRPATLLGKPKVYPARHVNTEAEGWLPLLQDDVVCTQLAPRQHVQRNSASSRAQPRAQHTPCSKTQLLGPEFPFCRRMKWNGRWPQLRRQQVASVVMLKSAW